MRTTIRSRTISRCACVLVGVLALHSLGAVGSNVFADAADSLGVPIDSTASGLAIVPILETRTIESPDGRRRVLLRPGDLSRLDGELILWASLEIPLFATESASELELRLYPLVTEWSANATWSHPWTRSGGDIDENYLPTSRVSLGPRTVEPARIDVTSIVRAWADTELGMSIPLHLVQPIMGFTPLQLAS